MTTRLLPGNLWESFFDPAGKSQGKSCGHLHQALSLLRHKKENKL